MNDLHDIKNLFYKNDFKQAIYELNKIKYNYVQIEYRDYWDEQIDARFIKFISVLCNVDMFYISSYTYLITNMPHNLENQFNCSKYFNKYTQLTRL